MKLFMIILPALAAGFVQGITGFGFGVIVVLFYPSIIGIVPAACVSQCLSAVLCLSMVLRYWKYIRWHLIILPLVFYFPIYFIAISCVAGTNMERMKWALGLFLILLSLFFLKFSGRLIIRPTVGASLICAGLAAIIDAVFGIGGPSMVVYFLAVTGEKEEYLGTIQSFFLVVCIYGTCMRIIKGMLGWELLPVLGWGLAAMLLGTVLAMNIVNNLDTAKVKRMVYGFIGIAGICTFITAVI